jgi:hypothetical protein
VLPALGSTGARNAVEVDPKTLLDSLTRPPLTQPPKLPKREEYLTIWEGVKKMEVKTAIRRLKMLLTLKQLLWRPSKQRSLLKLRLKKKRPLKMPPPSRKKKRKLLLKPVYWKPKRMPLKFLKNAREKLPPQKPRQLHTDRKSGLTIKPEWNVRKKLPPTNSKLILRPLDKRLEQYTRRPLKSTERILQETPGFIINMSVHITLSTMLKKSTMRQNKKRKPTVLLRRPGGMMTGIAGGLKPTLPPLLNLEDKLALIVTLAGDPRLKFLEPLTLCLVLTEHILELNVSTSDPWTMLKEKWKPLRELIKGL